MPAISIGDLRHRIRVERASGAAFVPLNTYWANVAPTGGVSGGVAETTTPVMGNAYEITTRYRTELTNQAPGSLRVRFGTEVISIASVTDVGGKRQWLLLRGQSFAPVQVTP